MTGSEELRNMNKLARTAGFLYFLLIPFGFFGIMYIPSLTLSGDAAGTVANIRSHEMLFRLSIICSLLTPIITMLTAVYLYRLLGHADRMQGALMVIYTVAAIPCVMMNELNHFNVLLLLHADTYGTALLPADLLRQVMMYLEARHYGEHLTSIFWGLWLIPLGYLIIKSAMLPKLIGALLIIAGIGYLADSAGLFLFPDMKISVAKYTFIGELALLLWLLIKGVKPDARKNGGENESSYI